MLLAPKPVPHTPSPSESRTSFTLGSASLVVGEDGGLHGLRGYEALPEWVEVGKEPDPSLREVDVTKVEYGESRVVPAGERLDSAVRDVRVGSPSRTNGSGTSGANAREKTLDDWLAEGAGEEGESEEEESEEEETEEEEEEESSEEASEDEESSEDDKEHDRLVK